MNGVAVILVASQLPRLFGISVHAESTLGKIWGVITNLGETSWRTLALGLVLLGVLALTARLGPKVPGRARRAPPGRSRGRRCSTSTRRASRSSARVPKGLPALTYPHVGLADFGDLAPARRRARARRVLGGDPHRPRLRREARRDGRREPRADRDGDRQRRGRLHAGLPDLCEPVAYGRRRHLGDADAAGADARRPSPSAVFLLFFTGILKNVPQVALAAIVIYAALGLFEERQLRALYRVDRTEFGLAIATFAGVVVFGMHDRHPRRGRPLARGVPRRGRASARRGARAGATASTASTR